jgi:RNA polymerase-binding transcription factor DksA
MMPEVETQAYRRLQALMGRVERDRSQLREEALQGTGGEASGGLSDIPIHPADLGSDAYEEELTLGLLENEEQLIGEINAALARMQRGEYGHCEACRRPIPEKRLRALPYARHCVPCARKVQGGAPPQAGRQL